MSDFADLLLGICWNEVNNVNTLCLAVPVHLNLKTIQ
jgi:hypothetical protein